MANDTAKCAMRIDADNARFAIDEALPENFSGNITGSYLDMRSRGNPK